MEGEGVPKGPSEGWAPKPRLILRPPPAFIHPTTLPGASECVTGQAPNRDHRGGRLKLTTNPPVRAGLRMREVRKTTGAQTSGHPNDNRSIPPRLEFLL